MHDRRAFLRGAGTVVLVGCARPEPATPKNPGTDEDISPTEDLMREHGALDRILLVYEEGIRRIDAREPAPLDTLAAGATIIGRFIQDYHEKMEEDFVFPRFEKTNKLVPLVTTLRKQHIAGRALTAIVLRLTTPTAAPSTRAELADAMRSFIRMYRPHESRENTVLFPAFASVMTEKELDELAAHFEKTEHDLFGKEGFEGILDQIVKLEEALGIHDLDRFTPPRSP